MAKSDTDKRLLETQEESAERVGSLPLEDARAGEYLAAAHRELTEGVAAFGAAINAEDVEEFEAVAARHGLNAAMDRLNVGFGKMKQGIDITLSRLQLSGALPSRADEVRSYVDDHTTSSFARSNVKLVRSVVQRGLRYADDLLPDDLREQIVGETEDALAGFVAARNSFAKEHAEHVAAFEKLETARAQAQQAHLNARDLTRAALRREGIEDRLNALIPTLRDAMYGSGGTPSPTEDADTPAPAPDPALEPADE